jgi:hypothetical protein
MILTNALLSGEIECVRLTSPMPLPVRKEKKMNYQGRCPNAIGHEDSVDGCDLDGDRVCLLEGGYICEIYEEEMEQQQALEELTLESSHTKQ